MYCKGTTWKTRGRHVVDMYTKVHAQPRGRRVESFFRVKSQKDSAIGTSKPLLPAKEL
jgi:hypothetical protein